jgi:hypothetical protein
MQEQTTSSVITLPTLAPDEVYAGLVLDTDGKPTHHLILLPGDAASVSWADAGAWAKNLSGELPTRQEQALLFANAKRHFKRTWYWSGEQYSEGYAWGQSFFVGTQYNGSKSYEARARAVRRFAI